MGAVLITTNGRFLRVVFGITPHHTNHFCIGVSRREFIILFWLCDSVSFFRYHTSGGFGVLLFSSSSQGSGDFRNQHDKKSNGHTRVHEFFFFQPKRKRKIDKSYRTSWIWGRAGVFTKQRCWVWVRALLQTWVFSFSFWGYIRIWARNLYGATAGTGWLARVCLAKTSFVLFLLIYATDSGGGVGCLDRKLDWNFRNIGDWAELVHFAGFLFFFFLRLILFMSSDLLFLLTLRSGEEGLRCTRSEPRGFYIIFFFFLSFFSFFFFSFRNSSLRGFLHHIISRGTLSGRPGRSVCVASIVS
ncbi:hypothetical protein B0T19DRAFT_267218 [Cercophora scortea]|uniref:Uncharacterized protein n=1 Tax=Cercophora scortea TaxID=314031 RepID=A0AAE0IAI3_9PEZI|nr:hypothetical protein B0T19DRAFT_267218 [Cercophora scortea]